MKRLHKLILDIFIVSSLFSVLFLKIGIDNLFSVLLQLNLLWLLPFFIFIFFSRLLYAVNIYILLLAINKGVNFPNVLKYTLLTQSIGKFFPGKFGELSLALILKKYEGIGLGEGLSVAVIDKLLSLLVLFSLGLLGLTLFVNLSSLFLHSLIIFFIIFIGFVVLLFLEAPRKFVRRVVLRKYSKHFKNFSFTLKGLVKSRKYFLLLNLVLTYIILLVTFIGSTFIFKSFGTTVPILSIAVFNAMITIITFLPLPFAGLGVREVSGTYLFSLIGVPLAVAANVMLFTLFFKYFLAFMFYLLLAKEL